MLFVQCLVAIVVAAAVGVVVISIVQLLPFVCAIVEIADLSGVFDEMCVCVWDY